MRGTPKTRAALRRVYGSAVIRHLVALRWPAAAHAAHNRCGTSPCRVRSPGHARPVQPSCRESSTPAARPDAPASAGLARRPPDGGSRHARWHRRLAAQGGGQSRSRGFVAICAATLVALYARRLRLIHRHLLRPGSRGLACDRNDRTASCTEACGLVPTADLRQRRTEAFVPSYPARRDVPPLGRPRRACTAKGSDVVLSGDR